MLSLMVEEEVAKKNLLNTLAGICINVDIVDSPVSQGLRGVVTKLLLSVPRVGIAKKDFSMADVMVLPLGTPFAIRQRIEDGGKSDRIVAIICGGLRLFSRR